VRRYVEDDELFMLTYGDGVSDVNIRALVDFHRAHGKIATVTAVHPPGRFGEMVIERGAVSEFNEKPQTTSGFINGGFFVMDAKRVWEFLGADPMTILEREPLRRLAAAGELVAFEHQGFWQPMDTFREYTMLNDLWTRGVAPWKTW
jgi:glucose-1-phosphate cytidylyltransferase